jgi:hypothetical protein
MDFASFVPSVIFSFHPGHNNHDDGPQSIAVTIKGSRSDPHGALREVSAREEISQFLLRLDEEHGISTLFDLRGYLEPAFLCWL